MKLGFKFGNNRANGFRVIQFLVFSKMAVGGHLGFKNSKFLAYYLIEGAEYIIPAKFGPFRTNRFDVIAILVNFNRRSAAILDFAKFHF